MGLINFRKGHRYGLASAPHVLEAYLDYVVCTSLWKSIAVVALLFNASFLAVVSVFCTTVQKVAHGQSSQSKSFLCLTIRK